MVSNSFSHHRAQEFGTPADDSTLRSDNPRSPTPPLSPSQARLGQSAPLMADHRPFDEPKNTATGLVQDATSSTPSLDNDGSPSGEKPHREGPTFMQVLKAWYPELLWVAFDIALLVALIIILAEFNDKPMPKWKLGLTLNTVVAILSTVSRAMTIIPLVEAMSQLKWNWFASKQRQLRDVYLFDQASRGPWGAMVLIFKTRGRLITFAWVAAVILVSGLATSFLTQSAVTYDQDRFVPVDNAEQASVLVAPTWPVFSKSSNVTYEHDPSFGFGITRSAIRAAFLSEGETWEPPQPRCPEVKCEWPPTSSLAVCASIQNVTEHLTFDTRDNKVNDSYTETITNATLPDGRAYLSKVLESGVKAIGGNMSASEYKFPIEEFNDHPVADRWDTLATWDNQDILSTALSHFYVVYSNNNQNKDPKYRFRAAELVYHLCVKTYDVGFNNSEPTTKTVSTAVKVDEMLHPGPKFDQEESSLTMLSEEGNGPFNVSVGWTFEIMRNYFKHAFTGHWVWNINETEIMPTAPELIFRNMFFRFNESTPDHEFDLRAIANLQGVTDTIGDAMTAYMREVDPNRAKSGIAYRQQTMTKVRWEWLSLLIIQIGLTLVFVVAVMIQTARLGMDVVKSSNTAELFAFQGMHENGAGSNLALETDGLKYRGIKTELSPTLSGQLVQGEHGWKLKIS
ncbi:unnamed protein product [Clonostachys rosea]|uniref:Uncharacterized protein n=1 Tax=Bionectria ochroleuca TaxID=29856 RepID=A0ABY6U0S7_BIOOC|nr:unnamed protein product [Clonostachys rosea]